ncbi:MAG: hypothetical protein LBU44_07925 [Mediterranea sp.]|jgi:hypothetical protein|nr:hypothetical protein [Mediterranea sp.]
MVPIGFKMMQIYALARFPTLFILTERMSVLSFKPSGPAILGVASGRGQLHLQFTIINSKCQVIINESLSLCLLINYIFRVNAVHLHGQCSAFINPISFILKHNVWKSWTHGIK